MPTDFLTRSTFLEIYATELAAEVLRLRAELAESDRRLKFTATDLTSRINAALEILDDPDDCEDAICRATEALWGAK